MTKAYSYIRFSTPEQAKGDSYRRQSEKARAYARTHGLDLDETVSFEDLGVSAYRGSNSRTGALFAFLQAVQTGAISSDSYLLVESLDRISRQDILDAQATFMMIVNKGVSLVTLGDGKVYQRETINANPTDLILSLVILMRSNEESRTKALRGKESWSQKRSKAAANQTPMTAQAPAWLSVDPDRQKFTVIEERAQVVRKIYQLASEGHGLTSIAQHLNQSGEPTWGRSKAWGRSFVLKLLHSYAPIGHFTPHMVSERDGQKVREPLDVILDYFPPILDVDLWERGRKEASLLTRGSYAVSHSLAGLARCSVCGGRLTRKTYGSTSKSGVPKLVHADKVSTGVGRCGSPSIAVSQVEEALLQGAVELGHLSAQMSEDGLLIHLHRAEAEVSAHLENLEEVVGVASGPGGREALRVAQEAYGAAVARRDALMLQVEASTSPLFLRDLGALRDALESQADPAEINRLLRSTALSVEIDVVGSDVSFLWRNGRTTSISLGTEFGVVAGGYVHSKKID